MSKTIHPRRVVLVTLRNMVRNTRTMIDVWTWTPKMRHYGQAVDPADSRESWDRLARYMKAVANEAEALRAYAEAMRDRT